MKNALIAYASLSGNTQEVAELIRDELEKNQIAVTLYDVGAFNQPFPNVADYDAFFIGTYTWARGSTPDELKDFVADVGFKPEPTYVFGTGDTQFGGDDLFCISAVRLAKFYHSPCEVLKIEQSPRGSQESVVINWVQHVLEKHKKRF